MRRPSLWRMVLSLIGAAVRLIAAHKQEAASPQRLLPVFHKCTSQIPLISANFSCILPQYTIS